MIGLGRVSRGRGTSRVCATIVPRSGAAPSDADSNGDGDVVRAARLMHGKTSPIYHTKQRLFAGLPDPFDATRYHSLIVKRETLPKSLAVTAWTKAGEIMGLEHRRLPVYGVQFHPESILTPVGKDLLRNFLKLSQTFHRRR